MSFPTRESAASYIEEQLHHTLRPFVQPSTSTRIDWTAISRLLAEGLYVRGLLTGVVPTTLPSSPPPFETPPSFPDPMLTVRGRCPACGHTGTLFLADGGWVTCSYATCPNPGAASDLLDPEDFDLEEDLYLEDEDEEDEPDLGYEGQDDGADEIDRKRGRFPLCPQCGQPYSQPACGPVHEMVALWEAGLLTRDDIRSRSPLADDIDLDAEDDGHFPVEDDGPAPIIFSTDESPALFYLDTEGDIWRADSDEPGVSGLPPRERVLLHALLHYALGEIDALEDEIRYRPRQWQTDEDHGL